jgi:methyltransferase (TIGR00027 family)
VQEGRPSRTAERVAAERAAHQILDSPRVLDDPLAIQLLSPDLRQELLEHPERHDRSPMSRPTRAIVVVRTRVAEDELAKSRAGQYVLLGAGLDTFAYRNPFSNVRVYEVDQPDTQALKRRRLQSAGVAPPPSLTFVACDFSRDAWLTCSRPADSIETMPAVFAWLGVVMYLDSAEVAENARLHRSTAGAHQCDFRLRAAARSVSVAAANLL